MNVCMLQYAYKNCKGIFQEKEKIFYYFPKDIDTNAKIRDVGLSQAFTAFTE